ncbi:hypothetical protein AGLY_001739 [Aphis glycines]|uniref:Uncharacterized protein n=1 Tax=Aphis glycines TaxID=307491 RepID=A0A6G0U5J8_APHGL|nr:hypothetical protein AGLY_001739 [Aphis glycines]
MIDRGLQFTQYLPTFILQTLSVIRKHFIKFAFLGGACTKLAFLMDNKVHGRTKLFLFKQISPLLADGYNILYSSVSAQKVAISRSIKLKKSLVSSQNIILMQCPMHVNRNYSTSMTITLSQIRQRQQFNYKLSLLFDSCIGCNTWTVDHLAKTFQQLLTVVIKVSVHFIDGLVLDNPQRTISVTDQSFVVRYNYDTLITNVDKINYHELCRSTKVMYKNMLI